jgi:hypothetical protein
MLLYPDAKKKEELEYLPECKAVGISEVELIVSGGVRGIPTFLMTRGLMVEIYRYAGKYFGGNCINKLISQQLYTLVGTPVLPSSLHRDRAAYKPEDLN